MSKTWLIVGGSTGIGRTMVEMLSKKGDTVHVWSRQAQGVDTLAGVHYAMVDIADGSVLPALPEMLHGVAYCPGSINLKPFRSLKADDFKADFDLNVLGAVRVLQETHSALKKSGSGSVVLFSTVAVGQGLPYHASVAAAKGAVEGLTKSLAAEWAPNVRVNAVAPSLTDTPLAERLLNSPEKLESGAKRHPLKRVGTTADIAAAALFLLGEESSWVSGQIIGVDGGMSTLRV